ARIRQHSPAAVVPIARPLAIALATLSAAVALVASLSQTVPASASIDARRTTAAALAAGDLRVTVTPPAYVQRPAVVTVNPASVSVIEGGHVRLETPRAAGAPVLVTEPSAAGAFRAAGDVFAYEFVAAASQALVV